MAAMLFGGDGPNYFPLSRSRVYEDELEALIGKPPTGGHRIYCLAMFILHDSDPYDLYQSVAAAILIPHGKSVVGGYLTKSYARRFRKEVADLGLTKDDTMLCKAICSGGHPFGKYTLPYTLALDLTWPLQPVENWQDVAAPFFENPLQSEFD